MPAFPYISWFILYVRIKSEFFVHTIWFVCTRYETHAGAFNYLLWAIKIIPKKKPSRFSSSISMIRHNRRTWYWNISWCKSVEIILHLYACLQNMKTKNRSNTCWEFKLYRLHELLRSQKKVIKTIWSNTNCWNRWEYFVIFTKSIRILCRRNTVNFYIWKYLYWKYFAFVVQFDSLQWRAINHQQRFRLSGRLFQSPSIYSYIWWCPKFINAVIAPSPRQNR